VVVCFVDIGGIVDYHCLKGLLIIPEAGNFSITINTTIPI
jgi:hypothetical protein